MTNPTQPLTAERIVKELTEALNFEGPYSTEGYPLADNIETYAAQQNAELLTKCEDLEKQLKTADVYVKHYFQTKDENERLKQQLAWQPISTAPKDGTSVLIFDNYREDKKVDGYNRVVARFDETLDRWMIHQRYGNYIACINPTKWMPLPQPPKDTPND